MWENEGACNMAMSQEENRMSGTRGGDDLQKLISVD